MKSLKFEAVFGVNEGYFHNNENRNILENISKIWQKKAKDIFEQTNIYISAVITLSKVVYHREWGCPDTGEDVIVITSSANPEFIKDIDLWKEVSIKILKDMQKELKQSRVSVNFFEVNDFIYLQES